MKAPPSEHKPRTLCPVGVQPARCVWLIDLGTQYYKPNDQWNRKLLLGFETPNAKADFGKGPQPFLLKRNFNFCMVAGKKKTKLREFIESWRGKPYAADADAAGLDFSKMVGVPCVIMVAHKQSQTGTEFEDIAAISPCKPSDCAAQINPSLVYDVADGRGGSFDKLPEWLQKQISESKEFTQPVSREPEPDDNNGFASEPDPFA